MSNYFQRLKRHPGVPIAAALTLFGVIAALESGDWWAVLVSSVWWIPVLITARTQP